MKFPAGGVASLEPGFRVSVKNTYSGPGNVKSLRIGSLSQAVAIGSSSLDNIYEVRSVTALGFEGSFVTDVATNTNLDSLPVTGDNLGGI